MSYAPDASTSQALRDRGPLGRQHSGRIRRSQVNRCSEFRGIADFYFSGKTEYCVKWLTHIVHLYGRLPRKTSNSKPAVSTVSQLM